MNFNHQELIELTRLGPHAVVGKALTEFTKPFDNTMVVCADSIKLTNLYDFQEQFPDKIVNVGIAEQNMLGIAAGLASEGFNVFAPGYASFLSARSFEMLKSSISYMNLNVKVLGLLSGFANNTMGNTHYCNDDLAITRTIPNLTVISPADGVALYTLIEQLKEFNGPCYIRVTGGIGSQLVYKDDPKLEIGKGKILQEGDKIAIIACGSMVYEASRLCRGLKKYNLSPTLIDLHTIKPLDEELLHNICQNHRLIVTIEEHYVQGGLGSAIAEFRAKLKNAPHQLMLGAKNTYYPGGTYPYMLKVHELTSQNFLEKILQTIQELEL